MIKALSLFLFKVKSGTANRRSINGGFVVVTFARPTKMGVLTCEGNVKFGRRVGK